MLKKIAIHQLPDLASGLMGKGTLVAPVRQDAGFQFREITDAKQVDLNYHNTVISPKSVFFPQTEDFVRYRTGRPMLEAETVEPEGKPLILFGVRPCDVKSFEIMDIHFSGTGPVDPYWQARREATTVIGYAFDLSATAEPEEFYRTLGIGAADPEGSDVFMVRRGDELLLKSITARGEALLEAIDDLAGASADDGKFFDDTVAAGRDFKTRFACVDAKAVTKKLEDLFHNTEFWEKAAAACLSCGVCTFACPTCYCFDICDETLFGRGTRRRVWDACMFTDFTLEASGHNPRT
ncbi:MAG TPA: 4Fe-4S dicluster domain-containing protein, partial [Smithellaceae bacterium]|nr:4Fe-4S dicluster domain-containing protein [Smithellaceae bacterium]